MPSRLFGVKLDVNGRDSAATLRDSRRSSRRVVLGTPGLASRCPPRLFVRGRGSRKPVRVGHGQCRWKGQARAGQMTPVSGGPSRYARGDPCARLFDDTIASAGPSRVARLRPCCGDRRPLSSSGATSGGASATSRCRAELTHFASLALRATLLLELGGNVQATHGGVLRDASEFAHAARRTSLVPRDASEFAHAARRTSLVPRDASEFEHAARCKSVAPRNASEFAHAARRTSVAPRDASEVEHATRAARAARHGPARTARRIRVPARDARSASRTAADKWSASRSPRRY